MRSSDWSSDVCSSDLAMRDHYQAKRAHELAPVAEAPGALAASEMGLIVCQDYDLYQKRLMQWGLRESELAQLRLAAIEARATDLIAVVSSDERRVGKECVSTSRTRWSPTQ